MCVADISMDFIGGLPRPKGMDTIQVVVDRLTKYTHFFDLVHPSTTKDVASLFTREMVHLQGFHPPSSQVKIRSL